MTKLKLAVAQINPTVGDIEGNLAIVLDAYHRAAEDGAELVVVPECALTGYPLEDLVLRRSFLEAVVDALGRLAEAVRGSGHDAGLIVGAPYPTPEGVANCAFLIDPRTSDLLVRHKTELPNYGVFDEKRVFVRIGTPNVMPWRGLRLGVMICEDCWFSSVSRDLADDGGRF